MKCPRCGLEVTDAVPRCAGCGFGMNDLDGLAGAVPARDGRLVDLAGALSDEDKRALASALDEASAAVKGDLVVVIAPRCPVPPATYAFWLFNRWELGGAENAGLLLLLALEEHRVECEVGYSWEGVLDEPTTLRLLEQHVVPALAEGHVKDALLAGVLEARDRLLAVMEAA